MPSLARVNKINALRRIKSNLGEKIILVDKKIAKEENILRIWLKKCGATRGVINSQLIDILPSGKLTISAL